MTCRCGKKPKPEPDIDATDVAPEHEWRMQMLEGIGFTRFQAFRLSVNGADWHEAKRLLDAGCDHKQVLDIIL